MATGRKSSKQPVNAQKGKFADVTFVTLNLDKAQKAEVKALQWDLDTYDTAILRLVETGYKVAVQEDTYNRCYSCFVSQRLADGENYGYILTGRGSSPLKAIKQAIFIGFHLLEGKFENYNPETRYEDLDD